MLVHSGLYRRSGDRMRCFHDSFESYFAARVLHDEFTEGRLEVLVSLLSDPRFFEPFEFLIEIAGEAGDEASLRSALASARQLTHISSEPSPTPAGT